jgi:dihydropteroate synthase
VHDVESTMDAVAVSTAYRLGASRARTGPWLGEPPA